MDAAYVSTPLTQAYFGQKNLDAIQTALLAAIQERGYAISRQSDTEVLGVMRGVYGTYSTRDTADIAGEVKRLNGIALEVLIDQVLVGIEQYLGYLKDASSLPVPPPRGENASNKGNRVLELMK